ncbi:hypothetical protein CVS40_9808 [Lucilia cuprina]|nr:hypothetical protein CVS40_9808 [Lucilia cuprina]
MTLITTTKLLPADYSNNIFNKLQSNDSKRPCDYNENDDAHR